MSIRLKVVTHNLGAVVTIKKSFQAEAAAEGFDVEKNYRLTSTKVIKGFIRIHLSDTDFLDARPEWLALLSSVNYFKTLVGKVAFCTKYQEFVTIKHVGDKFVHVTNKANIERIAFPVNLLMKAENESYYFELKHRAKKGNTQSVIEPVVEVPKEVKVIHKSVKATGNLASISQRLLDLASEVEELKTAQTIPMEVAEFFNESGLKNLPIEFWKKNQSVLEALSLQ